MQKNNKSKERIKKTKKECNRRRQLRDKIRRIEYTKWKQLQLAMRSSMIKDLMDDPLINYMKEE